MAHTTFGVIPGVDQCNYTEVNTVAGGGINFVRIAYGELAHVNFAIGSVIGGARETGLPVSFCISNEVTDKTIDVVTSAVLSGTNKIGVWFG